MVRGCKRRAESAVLLPATLDNVRKVLADIVGPANLERAFGEGGFMRFYFCLVHDKELGRFFPDWF